jgi:hypothetical protein
LKNTPPINLEQAIMNDSTIKFISNIEELTPINNNQIP